MTTLTNTEMLNNLMGLLEKMKLNDELDNHDDFQKLISKATLAAMKGSTKVIVKQKKGSNPYTDFVKAKMLELKDAPKGSKLKLIGEMWKAHKAAIDPMEIDVIAKTKATKKSSV
jgi:hypothetical protein